MIAPTPFFAHRGCHVRILEEIRALAARGHEVVLATYGLGDEVAGVRTVRALRVPWYRKLTAGPSWHKLYLDVFLLARSIAFARRFRPDVVHAHLHEGVFLGSIVAKLAGRPPLLGDFQGSMTTEMADHGFFSGWPWGERVFSNLEGVINRAPERIVVSSRQAIGPIAAARPGREATVTFLVDGVDAGIFRPDAAKREAIRGRLGIGAGELLVAYLGLLTEYQGVDLLLESARDFLGRVPAARLLVMGFPNEERYRALARRLGLGDRVVFTGRIDYAEAPAWLAAADVAVSPKLSLTEANGKLLDYMAVGLPTVVFESAINREVLADLGVFARYGDVADFSAKVVEVLEDAGRRKSLGEALRARALREYSWEGRALLFEDIYREMREPGAASGSAGSLASRVA